MLEYIGCDATNSLLGNTSKDGIAQFLKESSTNSCSAVWSQCQRQLPVSAAKGLHEKMVAPATVIAVLPTVAKSMFIVSTMLLK